MVATGYFAFDIAFGVSNSLLFVYFIAQVVLYARLNYYKTLRERLKEHLHLTVRTVRIRTERSRSGSEAAQTATGNLSRQPSRSNRIGEVEDRDALSPSPAVLSPSASSALAALGPIQSRGVPSSPSNSDSTGLLPDSFSRGLDPQSPSIQLAQAPRLITVDEHTLEQSSLASSQANRGSRAEERVSGDGIRIQIESPPPHDSHISSEDDPPPMASSGPLSAEAPSAVPRPSKEPVNFAPRSKSTSLPHVEFPVMGRIHSVFMAIGIIAGGLQVSRIPDALGVNDRYPLWLVRALSNAVAVVDIGLTTWVIYDFIRIRYITVFKFMPDWITRVLIASIVILTTAITTLVIVRSFYPDQWIWGMYSLWYGVDIILVLAIFDVCVYRLHMKIKEITTNWDLNKKNFSPAAMRKTESSSRLLGLNRLSTSATRRLTTSVTPSPSDKPKPSFSLRSFVTDVLNPNASVERELQAQTGVDRESGRLPERISIFHALQRVVRQTVHLATAFTVVGGVVGIYLLYAGVNKIAKDPHKQLVIVNDPEAFGSSTSDTLTSIVTTVFGLVVAWFSYIPFGFYFKDYTPLLNSAIAHGLLPAASPSACSPRIHF